MSVDHPDAQLHIGDVRDGGIFAVAVERIVGRPVSRVLDDGDSCEVTRLCTDGTPNACSKLYGACMRIAREMGYGRIVTYTLDSEGGASLRASGWARDADLPVRRGWDNGRARYERDLFGNRTPSDEPKVRWIKHFRAGAS